MLSLVIIIVVAFVLSIVLRVLRRYTRVIDIASYLLVLGVFAYIWYSDGIVSAVIGGVVFAVILFYMVGITSETQVKRYGKRYTFKCERCSFNDVDIVDDSGGLITIECPRCGYRKTYYLR